MGGMERRPHDPFVEERKENTSQQGWWSIICIVQAQNHQCERVCGVCVVSNVREECVISWNMTHSSLMLLTPPPPLK